MLKASSNLSVSELTQRSAPGKTPAHQRAVEREYDTQFGIFRRLDIVRGRPGPLSQV